MGILKEKTADFSKIIFIHTNQGYLFVKVAWYSRETGPAKNCLQVMFLKMSDLSTYHTYYPYFPTTDELVKFVEGCYE